MAHYCLTHFYRISIILINCPVRLACYFFFVKRAQFDSEILLVAFVNIWFFASPDMCTCVFSMQSQFFGVNDEDIFKLALSRRRFISQHNMHSYVYRCRAFDLILMLKWIISNAILDSFFPPQEICYMYSLSKYAFTHFEANVLKSSSFGSLEICSFTKWTKNNWDWVSLQFRIKRSSTPAHFVLSFFFRSVHCWLSHRCPG